MDTLAACALVYAAIALIAVGMMLRVDNRLSPQNQQPLIAALLGVFWPMTALLVIGACLIGDE